MGGFACTAKLRVKTSKALGDEFPIVVERSAADHDHQQDGVDKSERKYIPYTKKMDNDIEDGILDGLQPVPWGCTRCLRLRLRTWTNWLPEP